MTKKIQLIEPWQPMDTAYREGEHILLLFSAGDICVSFLESFTNSWVVAVDGSELNLIYGEPIAWTELPKHGIGGNKRSLNGTYTKEELLDIAHKLEWKI